MPSYESAISPLSEQPEHFARLADRAQAVGSHEQTVNAIHTLPRQAHDTLAELTASTPTLAQNEVARRLAYAPPRPDSYPLGATEIRNAVLVAVAGHIDMLDDNRLHQAPIDQKYDEWVDGHVCAAILAKAPILGFTSLNPNTNKFPPPEASPLDQFQLLAYRRTMRQLTQDRHKYRIAAFSRNHIAELHGHIARIPNTNDTAIVATTNQLTQDGTAYAERHVTSRLQTHHNTISTAVTNAEHAQTPRARLRARLGRAGTADAVQVVDDIVTRIAHDPGFNIDLTLAMSPPLRSGTIDEMADQNPADSLLNHHMNTQIRQKLEWFVRPLVKEIDEPAIYGDVLEALMEAETKLPRYY